MTDPVTPAAAQPTATPAAPAPATTTTPVATVEPTSILTTPPVEKADAESKPKAEEPTSPIGENFKIQFDANGDVVDVPGLKLPDEAKLAMSKEHLENLTQFARDRKLTPEQAQMLLDRENKVLYDAEKAQETMLAERRVSWEKSTKEDTEIGGGRFAETQELVSRAIAEFASPALKKALNDTGLGNHPELVRFVARFARKYMANDTFISGSASASRRPKTAEEKFYGVSSNG